MAQLPGVFKPSEKEDSSFSALPAGWYLAKITKSEMKKTKAGDGQYLKLAFVIIGGKYDKRMVWVNLNLVNKSETAVRIAESDLKKICEALGIAELEDSADLHGQPLAIKLSVKAATAQYPEGNDIKDYADESSAPEDDGEAEGENPFEGFGDSGKNLDDDIPF